MYTTHSRQQAASLSTVERAQPSLPQPSASTKNMPGVAVLGLACVVGGVVSSQGAKFFQSGAVIFVAVFLHNGLGYLLGYGAGKLVGMNTAKKRTIAIEVGMQNAGLATNLATTTAQFSATPESAIICAVSCIGTFEENCSRASEIAKDFVCAMLNEL